VNAYEIKQDINASSDLRLIGFSNGANFGERSGR